MDEGRMLLALSPRWRRVVVDVVLVGCWAACVFICYPLIQLATDHPPFVCLIEALAPGTLIYWGAVVLVLGMIRRHAARMSTLNAPQRLD